MVVSTSIYLDPLASTEVPIGIVNALIPASIQTSNCTRPNPNASSIALQISSIPGSKLISLLKYCSIYLLRNAPIAFSIFNTPLVLPKYASLRTILSIELPPFLY